MKSESKCESIQTRRRTGIDSKEDYKKTDVLDSSLSQKKYSYNFFGCCFRSQEYMQPSTFSVKKDSNRPSSKMNTKNGRVPHQFGNHKTSNITDNDLDVDPIEVDMDLTVRVYPVDIVFILGEKNKIVAKITVTKVLKLTSIFDEKTSSILRMRGSVRGSTSSKNSELEKDLDWRERGKSMKQPKLSSQAKKEIFSKYDKGIKCEGWEEVTPERIAAHIANRIKCDTIIDALCGFGSNTIQFAKTCNYVIAIDINMTKTLWAKHNSKVYKVDHKVDFLNSDFMTLRNISADVVFLDPSDNRYSKADPFSIFKNTKPDPLTLLAKSLEVSEKIVLQLPGDTEFEELPQLLHQSLEKYGLYSKRFCIEIEKVMNSRDEIERIIVYFGDCSVITIKQEYDAIYEYITRNETLEWKQKFPFRVITAVIEKVGIRRSFNFIAEIEEFNNKYKSEKSLFESFLDKIIEKNILNRLNLNGIIEEESFRGETFGMSPQSLSSPGTHTTRGFPTYVGDSKPRRIESLDEILENREKYSKALQPYSSDFKGNGNKQGQSLLTNKLLKHYSSPPGQTKKKESPPSTPYLNDHNNTMKNSYDMSELAVSSYSVTSSYLRDSDEDDSHFKKTLTDVSPDHINESSIKTGGGFNYAAPGSLSKKKLRERMVTYVAPKDDYSEMMLVIDKNGNRSFKKNDDDDDFNNTLSKSLINRRKNTAEAFKSVGPDTQGRGLEYNKPLKFESDDEHDSY